MAFAGAANDGPMSPSPDESESELPLSEDDEDSSPAARSAPDLSPWSVERTPRNYETCEWDWSRDAHNETETTDRNEGQKRQTDAMDRRDGHEMTDRNDRKKPQTAETDISD